MVLVGGRSSCSRIRSRWAKRLAGRVFRIGHLGDLGDLSLAGALCGVEMGLARARKVLEHVTVADVAAGKLPKEIVTLTREEEAWTTR